MKRRTLVSSFFFALVLLCEFNSVLSALEPGQWETCVEPTKLVWSSKNKRLELNDEPLFIKGIAWFGGEGAPMVPDGLFSRSMNDLLDFVRDQGFNAIRLGLSVDFLMNEIVPKSTDVGCVDEYDYNWDLVNLTNWQIFDQVIDRAAERGLLIMIDQHYINKNGQPGIAELWYQNPNYPLSLILQSWDRVITRWSNKWNVFAMDIKNEPHGAAGWGDDSFKVGLNWRVGAETIGNYILSKQPNWLIMVQGGYANVQNVNSGAQWWGGNLRGVRNYPVKLIDQTKLVYIPHVYGPSLWMQDYFKVAAFPGNMAAIWEADFGYVDDVTGNAVIIGEWGAFLNNTKVAKDADWMLAFVDWLKRPEQNYTRSNFYWALNPNSGDTGGVLKDDWITPEAEKLVVLDGLLPWPTRFTKRGDQVCYGNFSIVRPPPIKVENCSCVGFRLDDIQDYYIYSAQIAVMEVFKEEDKTPLTIGVIGDYFRHDLRIIDYVRNAISDPAWDLEVCSHGYQHEDFSQLEFVEQVRRLNESKLNIEYMLGLEKGAVTTFIPPFNSMNANTIPAVMAANYTVMSSQIEVDTKRPYALSNQTFYRVPIGAATNDLTVDDVFIGVDYNFTLQQILKQVATDGYSSIMMHPQEFSNRDPVTNALSFEVNTTMINELRQLIRAVKATGLKIVPLGRIPIDAPTGPLTKPVGPGGNTTNGVPVVKCNCIAFRFDALQDYYLANATKEILHLFDEYRIPLTAGLIGKYIGEDGGLVNAIRNMTYYNGRLELANNGFTYDDTTRNTVEFQAILMNDTNTKVKTLFQVTPTTYIPPLGSFVEGTVQAAQRVGARVFSSVRNIDPPPYSNYKSQVYRFPAGVFTYTNDYTGIPAATLLSQAQNLLNTDGFAVISLTPREFSVIDPVSGNSTVNTTMLANLKELFRLIGQTNIATVSLNGMWRYFDPDTPDSATSGLVPIPPTTGQPNIENCNCVAFRLDRVEDYYLRAGVEAIVKVFKEESQPMTAAIIGGYAGEDPTLRSLLINASNNVELASMGWNFETFGATGSRALSIEKQMEILNNTNIRIATKFRSFPITFVPPQGSYNQDTLEAMRRLGMLTVSSMRYLDPVAYAPDDKPSTWRFPGSLSTYDASGVTGVPSAQLVDGVQASIRQDGFSVVMMSSQEFTTIVNGTVVVNQTMVNELRNTLRALKNKGIKIVKLGEMARLFDATIPATTGGSIPVDTDITGGSGTTGGPVTITNEVAFRFDTVQDYYLQLPTLEVLKTFKQAGIPLTAAVLGKFFGDDTALLTELKANSKVEFANMGWDFLSFSTLTLQQQIDALNQGSAKLRTALNVTPRTFVPPFGSWNADTLEAMSKTGLTVLSSSRGLDPPPYTGSIKRLPAGSFAIDSSNHGLTANQIFEQVKNQMEFDGFAVIALTPREFAIEGTGGATNVVNTTMISELKKLLNLVKEEGYTIKTLGAIENVQTTTTTTGYYESSSPIVRASWIILLACVFGLVIATF